MSAQDRKEAEALFMSLRGGAISVDQCRQLLDLTSNHFLMFELARSLVTRALKDWSKYSLDELRNICDYLFNFPITHEK